MHNLYYSFYMLTHIVIFSMTNIRTSLWLRAKTNWILSPLFYKFSRCYGEDKSSRTKIKKNRKYRSPFSTIAPFNSSQPTFQFEIPTINANLSSTMIGNPISASSTNGNSNVATPSHHHWPTLPLPVAFPITFLMARRQAIYRFWCRPHPGSIFPLPNKELGIAKIY